MDFGRPLKCVHNQERVVHFVSKNVLIIGASGDIGIAISKQLAKEGHQLLLHYHANSAVMDQLWEELEEGQLLQIIQADLTNKAGIDKLLSALVFAVDAIVFANGRAEYGLFQDMSEQTMDEMLSLHVKAPWMITKHLLPPMIKKQSGKIIFITSIWGEHGASHEVLYSSVKGAQNSFVKALAKETASSGVSVHAISPGFIDTKMNTNLSQDERQEIYNTIPLKRPGSVSEVSEVVRLLLDSNVRYLNGQIIPVTGGWLV